LKKRLVILATSLALVLLLAGFALPTIAQNNEGTEPSLPPLELPENAYPKLDSHLNQIVSAESDEAALRLAQESSIRVVEDSVQVIIEALPGQFDNASGTTASLGTIETSHGDFIQALVPVSQLATLANSAGIRFVRTPMHPVETVVSEGVGLINADEWQASGYTGAGVKVAILDGGFTGYSALLGTELPATVVTQSFYAGSDIEGYSIHGTGCAEIVHDIAPDADLYLVNYGTSIECANAVDWLVAQGVDIISYSMGWFNAGPGDGTGFISAMVDTARNAGILWVNSIGNHAERHWQGAFADADEDGYHEFSGLDEGNSIYAEAGSLIKVFLRWDDTWGLSGNDFALLLYDDEGLHILSVGNDVQSGDSYPLEYLILEAPYTGYYEIVIGTLANPQPIVNFHLFASRPNLEYSTAPGSFLFPSDSPNALAVGAVDFLTPDNLESFSSQGPTDDGRIKPDIVAPDGVSNATYGDFFGTSASCPHVAGTAALVKEQNPSYGPDDLQLFLESRAVELGSPGKDNLFGSGRLHLRSPVDLTITTNAVTDIDGISATLNGELDGLGPDSSVDVSFIWGPDPQTDPSLYPNETTPQEMTSVGLFSASIDGLDPDTTCYVRAKAAGTTTVYGEERSFTTLAPDLIITDKYEEWVVGQEGVQYTVTFIVQNVGTAEAPAGHDVSLIIDGVTQPEQVEVGHALSLGSTLINTFSTVIDLSNDFDEVCVCADVNNEIIELNEDNNCLENTWPITPIEVPLVNGWNIIALSLQSNTDYTASTLTADINSQGGAVSQVFWWDANAGTWVFWLEDIQYGTNFPIELGQGYLLNNSAATTWTYYGTCPSFP